MKICSTLQVTWELQNQTKNRCHCISISNKKIQNTDKQNPDGVQEQKNFCLLLVGNTKWYTLEESLAVVYSNALTLSIDITLHRIYENEQKVYACKI